MKILWWQLKQLVKKASFWEVLFAPVGIGWTLTSIAIAVGYSESISPYLSYLWWLLVVGLVLAVILNIPKSSISIQLPNIDTEVEVRIGDIFQSKSPMVVTIPTTLETDFDNNAIDRSSIQGQFTLKYCTNPTNLSTAIITASEHLDNFEMVNNYYSRDEKVRRFPSGEVFVVRDFSRLGYLLTFATFNSHGTAQITPDDFLDTLPKLWLGVRERGDVGNIDVPLMGARFGRTGIDNRRDILRELINSFSAASAESRLSDKVTFYIRPSDFTRWGFTFEYIERMLQNICDDHRRRPSALGNIGKEVD
ncbi:macro domain-containing protein [Phaeobacter sp. JH20_10]|uniref:macro domain-containing protein n=1 Tax=Phaeobacter sp. JH20_10 TaxID=3112469 RepID=UPI003A883C58